MLLVFFFWGGEGLCFIECYGQLHGQDTGKETRVDVQAHGDARDMVQLIRGERFILQDSVSTQVYLNMLYICTCATYPYRP